jgi:hypothetical protein
MIFKQGYFLKCFQILSACFRAVQNPGNGASMRMLGANNAYFYGSFVVPQHRQKMVRSADYEI